jgi:hypothetical protein
VEPRVLSILGTAKAMAFRSRAVKDDMATAEVLHKPASNEAMLAAIKKALKE